MNISKIRPRISTGMPTPLSLVRGLVEMHGGSAEAQSDGVGKGSEFVVRLPVYSQPAAEKSVDSEKVIAAPGTPGRSVLIVDDNDDSATALAMFLQFAGDRAEVGHDGLEALEMAERMRPDIVLLDIGMPKLDGYEACRRIREKPWGKNMLLIAQTGWGADGDRKRTKEVGFDAHLVKPIDPDHLIKVLAELQQSRAKK